MVIFNPECSVFLQWVNSQEIGKPHKAGTAYDVSKRNPGKVIKESIQGNGIRVGSQKRYGENRHVRYAVFEPRGNEGKQAPENQDTFRRIAIGFRRHPNCETKQPVTDDCACQQLDNAAVHFDICKLVNKAGTVVHPAPATAQSKQDAQHDGAKQVALPADYPVLYHCQPAIIVEIKKPIGLVLKYSIFATAMPANSSAVFLCTLSPIIGIFELVLLQR